MDTSIMIEAELLAKAESVLHEGESLPEFVEQSVRFAVLRRQLGLKFVGQGLATGLEADQSGMYIDGDVVLRELDEMLIDQEQAGRH